MYRNTRFLIIFLAIFAALVAGVNIGKQLQSSSQQNSKITSDITPKITITINPTPSIVSYISKCGFTLQYPSTFTLSEESTVGAMLVQNNSSENIVMTCQKNISRPVIPATSIETVKIPNSLNTATISAKLYHDTSPEDQAPFDALIFRHPNSGKDVFLVGYGPRFDEIIKTLTIL